MADHDDYQATNNFGDYAYNLPTLQAGDLGAIRPFSPDTSRRFVTTPAHSIAPYQDDGEHIYNSYAGVDIVAQLLLPNDKPIEIGELQTISYSMHRENSPVRTLGHVSPVAFVKGGRTIAGSMIFTVFNNYAFYRLQHFQSAISNGLYPVSDMLPPVDIILTFANEFGVFSKMKLYGVTFVDEGGSMSIDDLISESTFSYMARGIQPLTGYVPREDG